MPPKTKTKLSQAELELKLIISEATKKLKALKQQRLTAVAKMKKVKEVPIIFEESPKSGVRRDRLDDIYAEIKSSKKRKEEEQRPKRKKKKKDYVVPIVFELSRSEKMKLNIQHRRKLLDEAIQSGYIWRNKRIPSRSELETYISENQVSFRDAPTTKKANNYEVSLKVYGGVISEEEALRSKNKRSKFLGKDHLLQIDENGEHIYYKAIRSNVIQKVEKTKLNLLKALVPGQIIKKMKGDGKEGITDEWLDLMSLFGLKDYELGGIDYNMYDHVDFIEILKVNRDHSNSTKVIPDKYIEKRKHRGGDDETVLTQCHPYITLQIDEEKAKEDASFLFAPVFQNEYLKRNYVPNRCVMDVIIESYSKSWTAYQGRLKKPKPDLSYEYLQSLFDISDEELEFGITFDLAVEKFFKPFNTSLIVYDAMSNIIFQFSSPQINTNLNPYTLGVVSTNGHLQLITDKKILNKISQLIDQEDSSEKEFTFYVNDKLFVPSQKDHSQYIKYLPDFKNIHMIPFDEIEEKAIRITVDTPLDEVLSFLSHTCRRLPREIRRDGNDMVSCINIKIKEKDVQILNPDFNSVVGELEFNQDDDNEQFRQYTTYKTLFNQCVNMIGHQSSHREIDMMKAFTPRPLHYRFDSKLKTTGYCDMIKAYTYCLLKMKQIPSLNQFDRYTLYKYNESEEYQINYTSFYIIKRVDSDMIPSQVRDTLLVQEYTEFRGEELAKFYNDFQEYILIVAEMVVSSTKQNKSPDLVKEIFDDRIMSEKQKKFIIVSTLGTIEKAVNRKKKVILMEDYDEALTYSRRYKTKMYDFQILPPPALVIQLDSEKNNPLIKQKASSNDVYVIQKEEEKKLIRGMYPVKLAIYSIMRYELFLMYKHVVDLGLTPTAVKTDCIYYHQPDDIMLMPDTYDSSSFTNIGKYRFRDIKESDRVPINTFKDRTPDHRELLDQIQEKQSVNMIAFDNEIYWETDVDKYHQEAFEIIDSQKRTLILGEQAGAGKTTLACNYILSQQDSISVGCALTNKRVIALRKDVGDDNAFTLHQLLNLRVEGGHVVKNAQKCENRLANVEILLIDEIYCFSTSDLTLIEREIFDKYPDLKIIATGDAIQSRFSDTNNITDSDTAAYYKDVIDSMFTTGITLKINKRVNDPVQQKKLEEIKSHLFSTKNKDPIPHLKTFTEIEHAVARHVVDGEFVGHAVCYHVHTVDTVNKLIHTEFIKQNPQLEITNVNGYLLYSGQELINRVARTIAGKRLYTNYSYIVQGIETNLIDARRLDKNGKVGRGKPIKVKSQIVTMKCELTNDEFFIPAKSVESFQYRYASTILSSQGDTYGDSPLTLFDFNAYMCKPCDKYTAISRTNNLEWVEIYMGQSIRIDSTKLKETIRKRIASHKIEDEKKGRDYEEEDYVSVDWAMNRFYSSNMTYPHCNTIYNLTTSNMSTFSIDRINDSFAHTKSNCVISCRFCNNSRKKL
ncbi:MAG: AAA family ATPase [Candidatus Pacebacteria bacterium]|nr:AAA family ATPase [Candidatus Paceibacterota bacterium]